MGLRYKRESGDDSGNAASRVRCSLSSHHELAVQSIGLTHARSFFCQNCTRHTPSRLYEPAASQHLRPLDQSRSPSTARRVSPRLITNSSTRSTWHPPPICAFKSSATIHSHLRNHLTSPRPSPRRYSRPTRQPSPATTTKHRLRRHHAMRPASTYWHRGPWEREGEAC